MRLAGRVMHVVQEYAVLFGSNLGTMMVALIDSRLRVDGAHCKMMVHGGYENFTTHNTTKLTTTIAATGRMMRMGTFASAF